jgi:hypothetical protein
MEKKKILLQTNGTESANVLNTGTIQDLMP